MLKLRLSLSGVIGSRYVDIGAYTTVSDECTDTDKDTHTHTHTHTEHTHIFLESSVFRNPDIFDDR